MSVRHKKYIKSLRIASLVCVLLSVFVFYFSWVHYHNPSYGIAEVFDWDPFQKFIIALLPNII